MNSKFYVSLEAARLLKEKGYNEETEYTIDNKGRIWPIILTKWMGKYKDEGVFPCPTKAEAIDWLDGKEVYIQIAGVGSGETQKWSYSVFDYKTCDNYASDYIFQTRLEAEEAVIIKALELL